MCLRTAAAALQSASSPVRATLRKQLIKRMFRGHARLREKHLHFNNLRFRATAVHMFLSRHPLLHGRQCGCQCLGAGAARLLRTASGADPNRQSTSYSKGNVDLAMHVNHLLERLECVAKAKENTRDIGSSPRYHERMGSPRSCCGKRAMDACSMFLSCCCGSATAPDAAQRTTKVC